MSELQIRCTNCKRKFYRNSSEINRNKRNGHLPFCSDSCSARYYAGPTIEITKTCPKCGREFKTTNRVAGRRKFCSRHCANSHENAGPIARWRTEERKCPVCEESFIPATKAQTICSAVCRHEIRSIKAKNQVNCKVAKSKKIVNYNRICLDCRKEFVAEGKLQRFCKNCTKLRQAHPLEDYSLDYIRKRIKINKETKCWEWQNSRMKSGYGQVVVHKHCIPVHRLMYMLAVGILDEGNVVHHACENIICCNPKHLISCTPKEHRRLHRELKLLHASSSTVRAPLL